LLLAFHGACYADRLDGDSFPIVAGELDGRFAHVGAVLRGHDVVCSGTLVEPGVVLTAAHCIHDELIASENIQFALGEDASRPTAVARVISGVRSPDYDVSNRKNPKHDIGLIYLDRELGTGYATLIERDLDERDDSALLVWVGYGTTSYGTGPADGRRRSMALPLTQRGGDWILSEPAPTGSVCGGDSGGAVFLADVSGAVPLVGVIHGMQNECRDGSVATRVDTNRDFIRDPYASGGCAVARSSSSLALSWVFVFALVMWRRNPRRAASQGDRP
jgi:hypothetical protein